jgi:hypothetical protein
MKTTILTMCLAAACAAVILSGPAGAVAAPGKFTARIVRLDGDRINHTDQADQILQGNLFSNQVVVQDVAVFRDTINMGGMESIFPETDPWPNGDGSNTLNNFAVEVVASIFIPEGDWTIAFGSDDGGFIQLGNVNFGLTHNENDRGRALIPDDGEIYYGMPRGLGWTSGHISAPPGGVTSSFRAIMFESGGGDGFEVAIRSGLHGNDVNNHEWTLLSDGALGWGVPEPTTLALLGLGGVSLLRRRRCAREPKGGK